MRFYSTKDTIVAISSPPGAGLKSVIRISGAVSHQIGKILVEQKLVSKTQIQFFHAPYSYTGEDMVEVYLMGSHQLAQIFLEKVESISASTGKLRHSEPGEFTFRAFMNKKLDLVQAEAVCSLISSADKAEADASLAAIGGSFSRQVNYIEELGTRVLGDIEAGIDFLDQEVEIISREEIVSQLNTIKDLLVNLSDNTSVSLLLQERVSCLLFGKTNAGKTTLFNRLVPDVDSIVSNIPGTTRDLIYGDTSIDGIQFRFIDSPGFMPAENGMDREAVRKTLDEVRKADIVLFVVDVTDPYYEHIYLGSRPTLVAYNKIDQKDSSFPSQVCPVSALTGKGVERLKSRLKETVVNLSREAKFRVTLRQQTALKNALDFVLLAEKNVTSPELLALDIREALYELAQISGKDVSEEVLSRIFSRFCIGK